MSLHAAAPRFCFQYRQAMVLFVALLRSSEALTKAPSHFQGSILQSSRFPISARVLTNFSEPHGEVMEGLWWVPTFRPVGSPTFRVWPSSWRKIHDFLPSHVSALMQCRSPASLRYLGARLEEVLAALVDNSLDPDDHGLELSNWSDMIGVMRSGCNALQYTYPSNPAYFLQLR